MVYFVLTRSYSHQLFNSWLVDDCQYVFTKAASNCDIKYRIKTLAAHLFKENADFIIWPIHVASVYDKNCLGVF